MQFNIETELEEDGRWIAEVIEVPGAMAYGASRDEAIQRAESLASTMPNSLPVGGKEMNHW